MSSQIRGVNGRLRQSVYVLGTASGRGYLVTCDPLRIRPIDGTLSPLLSPVPVYTSFRCSLLCKYPSPESADLVYLGCVLDATSFCCGPIEQRISDHSMVVKLDP